MESYGFQSDHINAIRDDLRDCYQFGRVVI